MVGTLQPVQLVTLQTPRTLASQQDEMALFAKALPAPDLVTRTDDREPHEPPNSQQGLDVERRTTSGCRAQGGLCLLTCPFIERRYRGESPMTDRTCEMFAKRTSGIVIPLGP